MILPQSGKDSREEMRAFAEKLKIAIFDGMYKHKQWSVDGVIDEYLAKK